MKLDNYAPRSEQTTRNQRRELHAVAERHGWHIVATYEDAGVSGAKGRDKRPGLDCLMMAVARREIDWWPRGPLIGLVGPLRTVELLDRSAREGR